MADEPEQLRGRDPSGNVLDLVEASSRRQDDLRALQIRFADRIADLREAHAREMRETARMYESRIDARDELIRKGEAARIDAIRSVDVQASERAAEVQAQQARTLVAQVDTTAAAMRSQVEATAAAAATALAGVRDPILARLTELERALYQTQGQKEQVVETRSAHAGAQLTVGTVMGIVGGVVGFLALVVAIFIAIRGH